MELRIKLEGYKDRMDIFPSGEADCKISIDQNKHYLAQREILNAVLRHLYQIITERMNAVTQAE